MKKMQSGFLKIALQNSTLLALLLCVLSCQPAVSQISSHRLKTADSLFAIKRYTQSMVHYEHILQQNEYTPVMLLKMAYIQEGLLHIGQAMYYLNLYYLATSDTTALEKMSELARKYDLEGYETAGGNISTFYRKYHLYISLALGAVTALFFVITLLTRLRLKRQPVIAFSFVTLFTVLLGVHLYFGTEKSTGIITQSRTYIMSGPSAGASVIDVIGDGHKVEVTGKKDVWLRIRWNDNIAYIRKNALQPIQL